MYIKEFLSAAGVSKEGMFVPQLLATKPPYDPNNPPNNKSNDNNNNPGSSAVRKSPRVRVSLDPMNNTGAYGVGIVCLGSFKPNVQKSDIISEILNNLLIINNNRLIERCSLSASNRIRAACNNGDSNMLTQRPEYTLYTHVKGIFVDDTIREHLSPDFNISNINSSIDDRADVAPEGQSSAVISRDPCEASNIHNPYKYLKKVLFATTDFKVSEPL